MTTWGTTEDKAPIAEWTLWGILLGTVLYAFHVHVWVQGTIGLLAVVALYVQMREK